MATKKVLFLCTGNSCRSQMAEGWAKYLFADQIESFSAGIETHGMNPYAVKVMGEVGVSLNEQKSELLDDFDLDGFDLVVTVCAHAHESCPIVPSGCRVIHHGFDDPPRLAAELSDEEEKLDCYRRVREQIKEFVETLPSLLKEEAKG